MPLLISNTQKLKCLSSILMVIYFALGIINFIALWKTIDNSNLFVAECPYKYRLSDIDEIINYNGRNLKKKCQDRICVSHKESTNQTEYVCSFNSANELLYSFNGIKEYENKGNFIYCGIIDPNEMLEHSFEKYELFLYAKKCSEFAEMHFCTRKNKSIVKTPVNHKAGCPQESYKNVITCLGILLVLGDIMLSFMPLCLECCVYKNLLEKKLLKDSENEQETNENEGVENNEQENNEASSEKENENNTNYTNNNEAKNEINEEKDSYNQKDNKSNNTEIIIVGRLNTKTKKKKIEYKNKNNKNIKETINNNADDKEIQFQKTSRNSNRRMVEN